MMKPVPATGSLMCIKRRWNSVLTVRFADARSSSTVTMPVRYGCSFTVLGWSREKYLIIVLTESGNIIGIAPTWFAEWLQESTESERE